MLDEEPALRNTRANNCACTAACMLLLLLLLLFLPSSIHGTDAVGRADHRPKDYMYGAFAGAGHYSGDGPEATALALCARDMREL